MFFASASSIIPLLMPCGFTRFNGLRGGMYYGRFRQNGVLSMGRVFAVTSGKGGVGKSTVSVGLALAFCGLGRRVLLVDMDEGLRCLDLMLGVDKSAVFDLSDILLGREINDAVYKVEQHDGLYLVPAPQEIGKIDTFTFTAFAAEASKLYDTVIFDFPAGMDFTLYPALPPDTLFLTVASPDPVSVRDASAVSMRLGRLSLSSRLVINNFTYKLCKSKVYDNIDGIIDSASLQLIGIIPSSEELALLSVNHALSSRGKPMKAFNRLAKRLEGEHILLPNPKKI